ncbi:hypothetical protein AVEN_38960-1 [Araneus ventricosus]|uniref:Uncharacterized protein n=1 Tax=Araneus ventricosus TaxID=182803 RepID=A0A4Y2NXH5_ARAVE|nr:hypothetical protein AVEN_38960-1 [Araneus ventricosus]
MNFSARRVTGGIRATSRCEGLKRFQDGGVILGEFKVKVDEVHKFRLLQNGSRSLLDAFNIPSGASNLRDEAPVIFVPNCESYRGPRE